MKKVLFIYNPYSGKALIRNYIYDILQELSAMDCEIIVRPTRARLDAYEYIIANEGKFDLIVCSGGDGTLNETVSALMAYKSERTILGYIPSGTTNDFARSLEISKKMSEAAKYIVEGVPQKVDIGKFNDRYFTYVAAIGAFTQVSYETPQNMKNILGHQAYILEGIKKLTTIKPKHMMIETEHGTYEGDFVLGMITNAKSVGGYKGITGKHVKMNDGLFEVTFVRYPTNPTHIQQIASTFLMQDYSSDIVYFDRVNKIKITTDEELPWVLDGEFGGDWNCVEIGVEQQAIDIVLAKDVDAV